MPTPPELFVGNARNPPDQMKISSSSLASETPRPCSTEVENITIPLLPAADTTSNQMYSKKAMRNTPKEDSLAKSYSKAGGVSEADNIASKPSTTVKYTATNKKQGSLKGGSSSTFEKRISSMAGTAPVSPTNASRRSRGKAIPMAVSPKDIIEKVVSPLANIDDPYPEEEKACGIPVDDNPETATVSPTKPESRRSSRVPSDLLFTEHSSDKAASKALNSKTVSQVSTPKAVSQASNSKSSSKASTPKAISIKGSIPAGSARLSPASIKAVTPTTEDWANPAHTEAQYVSPSRVIAGGHSTKGSVPASIASVSVEKGWASPTEPIPEKQASPVPTCDSPARANQKRTSPAGKAPDMNISELYPANTAINVHIDDDDSNAEPSVRDGLVVAAAAKDDNASPPAKNDAWGTASPAKSKSSGKMASVAAAGWGSPVQSISGKATSPTPEGIDGWGASNSPKKAPVSPAFGLIDSSDQSAVGGGWHDEPSRTTSKEITIVTTNAAAQTSLSLPADDSVLEDEAEGEDYFDPEDFPVFMAGEHLEPGMVMIMDPPPHAFRESYPKTSPAVTDAAVVNWMATLAQYASSFIVKCHTKA